MPHIQIVEGYSNGIKQYRVYINMNWTETFESYDEALSYKMTYEKMILEKASIADDEHKGKDMQ